MDLNGPSEPGWAGDIPVYLLIVHNELNTLIDLDQKGWLETYAHLMRVEATWHLVSKKGGLLFSLVVLDGEQPYYVARHFARASMAVGQEEARVSAYGIGKKRRDGHVDRLWVFTNGQICTGDDVDIFGRAFLAQM